MSEPQRVRILLPIEYYILFSLFERNLNSAEILRSVREQADGRDISTATLYRIVGKLVENGSIVNIQEDGDEFDRRIRAIYKLTNLGRQMLEVETGHRLDMAYALENRE